jgi:hypothetical protein
MFFIVYVKAIVSFVLCAWVGLLLWQRPAITRLLQTRQFPWLMIFYGALRLLPFIITYLILGYEPQSDVQYFYPIIASAKKAELVYRDVYSCYAPFFGYWLSIPFWLWHNNRMTVLTMTVIEWAAVWLTVREFAPNRLSKNTQPSDNQSKKNDPIDTTKGDRLFKALVYFSLPLPFVMCVFSGQEDVVLWLFALWAVVVWQKRGPFWGGIVLALGLLSTKAVFIFSIIPLFFVATARQKLPLVLGLAVLGLPVVVFLYLNVGTLFIDQPLFEGTYLKAPNWRSVLNPVIGRLIPANGGVYKWLALLITALIPAGVTLRYNRNRPFAEAMALLFILAFCTMTVMQQNAISNYAYFFMLPLIFVLTDFQKTNWWIGLLGFNVLAAVHPSLWWRLGQPYYKNFEQLSRPDFLFEYCVELLLVAGFIYYAWQAARKLIGPMQQP